MVFTHHKKCQMRPKKFLLQNKRTNKYNHTLRKEDGHRLSQDVIEAGDNEHLLGADDVVLQNEREDGEEQADARREHDERRENTADVRRGPDLLDFLSAIKKKYQML